MGKTRLEHMVDLGTTTNDHTDSMVDLCGLPNGPLLSSDSIEGSDLRCSCWHHRVRRRTDRLLLSSLVAVHTSVTGGRTIRPV